MLSGLGTPRQPRERPSKSSGRGKPRRLAAINRLVEDDLIRRVSLDEYQAKVKDVYGGPKGAMLAACSLLSLHVPLGERIFRTRRFDLAGMKSILDVGSGAGQIAKHLLKYSDPRGKCSGGRGTGSRATCRRSSPPTCRHCRLRMDRSTASPAATCSNTCRIRKSAWPSSRE
jgi:hypothetical protein